MKYFEHLEANKKAIIEQLELIFTQYSVEPVGGGYIDCIVQKSHLVDFTQDLSMLGIAISDCSWWCYVDTSISKETGCPHGIGGTKSKYYKGWYSELQNEMLSIRDALLKGVQNTF